MGLYISAQCPALSKSSEWDSCSCIGIK